MEIKLNGKSLLGIALLSVGLSFGDYVSLINAKSSGGYSLSGNGAFAPYGGKTVVDKIDGGANQGSIYRSVYFRASLNWSGSTSSEGVQNATLDVRGQRIKINVWKRVS